MLRVVTASLFPENTITVSLQFSRPDGLCYRVHTCTLPSVMSLYDNSFSFRLRLFIAETKEFRAVIAQSV
jgi:hypothetical protein